jgi:hypothetical protein
MAINDFNITRLDVHFGKTIATMVVANITLHNVIAKFRTRCLKIYSPLLTKKVKFFEKDICGCY